MSDFTNATSQTLSDLRSAEQTLNKMLWNAGDVIEKISSEQISRDQIDQSVRSFTEASQQVQQSLHKSISNLEKISSGLAHEDSCYGSWIDFTLAMIRTDNIRNQLIELKNNQSLNNSRHRVQQLEIELAQLWHEFDASDQRS